MIVSSMADILLLSDSSKSCIIALYKEGFIEILCWTSFGIELLSVVHRLYAALRTLLLVDMASLESTSVRILRNNLQLPSTKDALVLTSTVTVDEVSKEEPFVLLDVVLFVSTATVAASSLPNTLFFPSSERVEINRERAPKEEVSIRSCLSSTSSVLREDPRS